MTRRRTVPEPATSLMKHSTTLPNSDRRWALTGSAPIAATTGRWSADEDAPLMYYRRSWGVWKPAPRQIGSRAIPALEVSGQDLLWEGAEL